ncbi:MAG: oxaloacetate decarboxylase subunit alpha, partial [Deltaproteobacteria bacterium]|nr:oxaloacetate decarboxylase subunit alpha [Deltaproteobacteria bacterium]
RSADYIPAELEKNREKIGSLAKTEEDLLIYSLYPSTGKRFLKEKYEK